MDLNRGLYCCLSPISFVFHSFLVYFQRLRSPEIFRLAEFCRVSRPVLADGRDLDSAAAFDGSLFSQNLGIANRRKSLAG